MKAIIYNRISTDNKDQNPENNLEVIKEFCKRNNFDIEKILIDKGVSGDTEYFERENGKEIDNIINNKKEDKYCIVVFSIDRFTRQYPIKALYRIEQLEEKGIDIYSATESIFNEENEFSLPMKFHIVWFNYYFLQQHSKKVKAGMENAKLKGTRSNKSIGKPRKADYKKILELYNDGLNISEISRKLKINKSSVFNAIKSFNQK